MAGLAFHALDGNAEAFASETAERRPIPGVVAVAAILRSLAPPPPAPRRLQDPYGLRALPSVAGALRDALDSLGAVLSVEANAAAENPLIDAGREAAFHHGGFHLAPTALSLDTVRLGLVPFAALSAARLGALMEPALSGLSPFLAAPEAGSSGLMIAEYVTADALARLRTDATPSVPGAAVVSRGLEEHASFGWQGARQAQGAVRRLRTILAVEWVAAERALRLKARPAQGPLAPARELARGFDARLEDRPLGEDVAAAESALADLADVVEGAAAG